MLIFKLVPIGPCQGRGRTSPSTALLLSAPFCLATVNQEKRWDNDQFVDSSRLNDSKRCVSQAAFHLACYQGEGLWSPEGTANSLARLIKRVVKCLVNFQEQGVENSQDKLPWHEGKTEVYMPQSHPTRWGLILTQLSFRRGGWRSGAGQIDCISVF